VLQVAGQRRKENAYSPITRSNKGDKQKRYSMQKLDTGKLKVEGGTTNGIGCKLGNNTF